MAIAELGGSADGAAPGSATSRSGRPSSGSWPRTASPTAALADATGLSAGYLNHLVHGNRPVPSNEVIERLAKALGVEPEHFREYRLRAVAERLEQMPDLADRLYKRSR